MEVPRVIEIGKPLTDGWNRMTRFCFEPFDIGKWFVVGFCAFLMGLGDVGIGPNFNFNFNMGRGGGGPNPFQHLFDWGLRNPLLVVVGFVFVSVLGFVLMAALEFLAARGGFMLLHNLVQNKAEVSVPWRDYAERANGFWLFRIRVLLMAFILGQVVTLICAVLAWGDINARRFGGGALTAIILAVCSFIPIGFLFTLFKALTSDFVCPHMYQNGSTAGEAWRAMRAEVVAGNVGSLILFYLVRFALGLASGVVILIGTVCTCCIGGLPYLSSVLFLPIAIFFRAFTLHYLRQFGPQWDVFEHNALECPLCGYDLRGNPAAVSCPECGAEVSPSATPQTNPWGPAGGTTG